MATLINSLWNNKKIFGGMLLLPNNVIEIEILAENVKCLIRRIIFSR